MIYDKIENLSNYGDTFSEVVKFIQSNDLHTIDAGRYQLEGNSYVDIQEYKTKPDRDYVCEVHKKYIDLQLIVKGSEKMLYGMIVDDTPKLPYIDEKDVAHHNAAQVLKVPVGHGYFCVFFPGEFHKPGLSINAEGKDVRKALFKIHTN